MKFKSKEKGLTLIEVVVGSAIFALIAMSVYEGYVKILQGVQFLRVRAAAIDLLNEQVEIIRNIPYDDIGIVGGIPNGVFPHIQSISRNNINFDVTATIRNIDDPFDGTIGGSPNDLSPADNKLVEISVSCPTCRNFQDISISTRVAPKNLETATQNGALFVQVFDASGVPVPQANVHIENNKISPAVVIDDVTNNDGMLQIVDAPPGVEAYEIMVSKSGFSTEKTYATGDIVAPNPTKPHATVVIQQVTQLSFSIDKLSSLVVNTMNAECSPISDVDFNLSGSKMISLAPDVHKYNLDFLTNSQGEKNVDDIEWDTYVLDLTDSVYDLIGITQLGPITINPNSTENVLAIIAPSAPNRLMVTVKDSASNLPLSGATVNLVKGTYNQTKLTGQGFLGQTDWSGGSGQDDFIDSSKYFSSDGNVENNNPAGEIKLKEILGEYVSGGVLTSSVFDTGTSSNFHKVLWEPQNQPVQSGENSLRFQVSTSPYNTATTTWNFWGPDGTSESYYTSSDQNISDVNDGGRYFRYKAFLATESSTSTPTVSDVSFTYSTACAPSGQVSFGSLSAGEYTLTVSRSGYQTYSKPIIISQNWQEDQISLSQ